MWEDGHYYKAKIVESGDKGKACMNRRKKLENKDLRLQKRRILNVKCESLKENVTIFFRRDDNSRVLLGKNVADKFETS